MVRVAWGFTNTTSDWTDVIPPAALDQWPGLPAMAGADKPFTATWSAHEVAVLLPETSVLDRLGPVLGPPPASGSRHALRWGALRPAGPQASGYASWSAQPGG